MIKKIERKILEIIENDEKSTSRYALKKLLELFSYGYSAAIAARNFLYDIHLFKCKNCSAPVVSIGNILAGGTGKTPFTALLAKELSSFTTVGILLRGYRAEQKKNEIRVVSVGHGPIIPVEKAGDEAFLLAKKIPQAVIVVGKDRFKAAQEAKKQGAKLLLMDDGFQHRKMRRDLELVLVRPEKPFGNGYFLPRGLLRDQPKRLEEADYFVAIGGAMPGEKPTIVCRIVPDRICYWQENQLEQGIESFTFEKVATFCGIAQPHRFIETVKSLGKEVVKSVFLADHEKMSFEKLYHFSLDAKQKGAEVILCTEKDYVKLGRKGSHFDLPLPVASLNICWEIASKNEWLQLIEKIKKIIG